MTTAASVVANMIRERVGESWLFADNDGQHWLIADRDPDYIGRYVVIDTDGTHPVVRAYCRGGCRLTLEIPSVSDNRDRASVLAALTAFGAIPDEDGMNH